MQTKFVVVLGSLMSGLGKGVLTSSILKLLDLHSYNVLPLKFDGYLNYDAGTMNPYRHGEVFVLDDSSELDMDFGMYERFLCKDLTGDLSLTGGKIMLHAMSKERRGDYLGDDVQIIPHVTNEIILHIERVANEKKLDVLVIEVGGTVGDIENSYFIEAMRQLSLKHKVVFVNLTYVPRMSLSSEQKTKPTQLAFRQLMQLGIKPDFLVCRSESKLGRKVRDKLAMFTSLSQERVIDDQNLPSIYSLPISFIEQKLDSLLLEALGLKNNGINEHDLTVWKDSVHRLTCPSRKVKIAIVGKYAGLEDAYASVKEAIAHAGMASDCGAELKWIESTDLNYDDIKEVLKDIDGVIVPGGFGFRGTEGKINAIRYARENKIPYLGLCLGMQLMAVEYARNVAGFKDADSTEFNKETVHPVISLMPSQKDIEEKGGTMRLGAWKCKIEDKNTLAYALYGSREISERHRHRYELNNDYREDLKKNGLVISGTTPDDTLVEIIEWKDSFGIATQAHPELKTKMNAPAPLFLGFIKACAERQSSSPFSKGIIQPDHFH